MKRIKGDKVLEEHEMHELANMLSRCGFHNAAVGINYIDFYDRVEIWSVADAARKIHTGDDR
jgi:hypothetical protein